MTTIIDASVALKWVCDETDSERAAALLDGRPLAAPDIWIAEAANALWRRARTKELTNSEADARLCALQSAPVRGVRVGELTVAALKLAIALSHPVYDCLYLAAALMLTGTVITADRRFYATAQSDPQIAGRIRLL